MVPKTLNQTGKEDLIKHKGHLIFKLEIRSRLR